VEEEIYIIEKGLGSIDKDFGKRNSNPEQNAAPDDLVDRYQVDNRGQFNDGRQEGLANVQASPTAKVSALTLPLNLLERGGMTALGIFVLVDPDRASHIASYLRNLIVEYGKMAAEHANVVGASSTAS
ncbi:hypothetical protein MHYMCMPSP_01071, partial [Hyalomma marginatum]